MTLLCLWLTDAKAIIANGSIAPDFTVTDIYGVTHNLYDYCDSGYSTVIDFSATWCNPCWNYHLSDALDDVYSTYGPSGSNQLRVIFLESDPGTSLADIHGTGSSTLGNWSGTADFPIVDLSNGNIPYAYGVSGFPTVGIVCPSKKFYNIGTMSANGIATFMDNYCPVAQGANNVELTPYYGSTVGCYDIDPFVRLVNMGTNPLSSANISLSLDGSLQQNISWTGNLPPYEDQIVYFNSIVPVGNQSMQINVDYPNGFTDADPSNNATAATISLSSTTTQSNVTCTVTTDDYGYETYWEITDESGNLVHYGGNANASPGAQGASSGDYNAYIGNSTYSANISLPTEGCYTFTIIDDFGDGMCCNYGPGSYTLIDDMGNTLLSGGQFSAIESTEFLRVSNNILTVRAKIALEGAMESSLMRTDLRDKGLLPTFQPFTSAPWHYGGIENASWFPTNAVDWVLVELRTGISANSKVAEKAGILLSNGEIVDPSDPSDGLLFSGLNTASSYHVVIRARGHLDVMSKSAVNFSTGSWYDFTTSSSKAYGSSQMKYVNGKYALLAGDSNGDGLNNYSDFNQYLSDPSALLVLLPWDYDCDGYVTVLDYNLYKANYSRFAVSEVRF